MIHSKLVLQEYQLQLLGPGPKFNIKMSSYQYRKSHCGDKRVVRSSYLQIGISYTGKMAFLYWTNPWWQIYASINCNIIGPGNGSSPVWCHAITETIAGLCITSITDWSMTNAYISVVSLRQEFTLHTEQSTLQTLTLEAQWLTYLGMHISGSNLKNLTYKSPEWKPYPLALGLKEEFVDLMWLQETLSWVWFAKNHLGVYF